MPEALRRLNFIFFDDPGQFEASADKLAEALQTDIGWIRLHTEFGEAARHWIEGARAGGLLLRPPVLGQAEAWMALRPSGTPSPTTETEAFIAASRKAEVEARRRSRILNGAVYTMLVGIILGLIGWINQSSIAEQWRWFHDERPFAEEEIWPDVLAVTAERALKPGDTFRECSGGYNDFCPEMVVIPAGSFVGSPPSTEGRQTSEGPQQRVTIPSSFAVSKYEVTSSEWETCIWAGDCPVIYEEVWGKDYSKVPVINVNWREAEQYVKWLTTVTGKQYRLLTNAEYEYVARAGTTTAYPWGDDIKLNGQAMANCNGCGSKWDNQQTAPVGSFSPNKFGLYDMVGNVWEWVEDCTRLDWEIRGDGTPTCTTYAIRGSSWDDTPDTIRSTARNELDWSVRRNNLGFRVGRTLLAPR